MSNNGQRPQDSQGAEGRQEGPTGFHLQQSPSATDGGDDGKEGTSVLIHIENSSQRRSLLLEASTTAEVKAGIFRVFPNLNCSSLCMEVFSSPYGSKGREPITGALPKGKELYATLYLAKH